MIFKNKKFRGREDTGINGINKQMKGLKGWKIIKKLVTEGMFIQYARKAS